MIFQKPKPKIRSMNKDEILLDWLRENKDLYKREAMARKLHIGIDTLTMVFEHKKISKSITEQITRELSRLLLHNNDVVCENWLVIKLYAVALIEKYNKLPWLDLQKKQIYDDLETLQALLIKIEHPLRLFINTMVNDISKEIVENKEKAG